MNVIYDFSNRIRRVIVKQNVWLILQLVNVVVLNFGCQVSFCLYYFTYNTSIILFQLLEPLDVPVCSLSDVGCYSKASDEMNVIIANQTKSKLIDPDVTIMCDCMPSCNSLDYNFEISRAYYDFEKTILAQRDVYEHGEYVFI